MSEQDKVPKEEWLGQVPEGEENVIPPSVSVADVLGQLGVPTDLTPLDDLLNVPVVIETAEDREGTFGVYMVVQGYIFDGGARFVTATGGEVLCRKLRAVREALPLRAQFTKHGRYYDVG